MSHGRFEITEIAVRAAVLFIAIFVVADAVAASHGITGILIQRGSSTAVTQTPASSWSIADNHEDMLWAGIRKPLRTTISSDNMRCLLQGTNIPVSPQETTEPKSCSATIYLTAHGSDSLAFAQYRPIPIIEVWDSVERLHDALEAALFSLFATLLLAVGLKTPASSPFCWPSKNKKSNMPYC